jgi:hypothetical protein
MKRTFMVYNIPNFKGWEICFRTLIEKADTFRIIFQGTTDVSDADTLLNAGKREFLSMPSITVSPYDGMENSIQVTGELDMAARKIFLTYMESAFEGYKPDLWSFQFLVGNDVILRVDDFSDGLLFLEDSEVEDLFALGVDGSELEEIDNFSVESDQPDVIVGNWSNEDLSSLTNLLQKEFLEK